MIPGVACALAMVVLTPGNSIIEAIEGNRLERVAAILKKRPDDANMVDNDGHSALVDASDIRVSFRIFELLVRKGADLHRGVGDMTLACWICAGGAIPFTDSSKVRPVVSGGSVGQVRKMALTISLDPDELRGVDRGGVAPYEHAVRAGNLPLVVYFNKMGICASNALDWTADIEVVRYLLGHGADPRVGSPLCTCCAGLKTLATLRLELEHGADPNVESDGTTPLMCLAENLHCTDATLALGVRILVAEGANPMFTNRDGRGALDYAVADCRPKTVEALMDVGAAPGLVLMTGFTFDNSIPDGSHRALLLGAVLERLRRYVAERRRSPPPRFERTSTPQRSERSWWQYLRLARGPAIIHHSAMKRSPWLPSLPRTNARVHFLQFGV